MTYMQWSANMERAASSLTLTRPLRLCRNLNEEDFKRNLSTKSRSFELSKLCLTQP
jgi:hypothetical protein